MKKIIKTILLVCVLVTAGFLTATKAEAAVVDQVSSSSLPASVSLTPNIISNGSENINNFKVHTIAYDANDVIQYSVQSSVCGVVVPINIPEAGDLYLDSEGITVTGKYSSTYIEIGLYQDVDCKNRIGTTTLLGEFGNMIGCYPCPKGGTYYLKLFSEVAPEKEDSFSFRSYFYSAEDKTLKSGNWQAIAKTRSADRYYKMVIPSDGNVKIEASGSQAIYVCSENKAVKYGFIHLMDDPYNDRTTELYLKAGTYYIRTCGASGASNIRYTHYAVGKSPYTVSDKQTFYVYPAGGSSYVYIKYTAKVTGYITLSKMDQYESNVTLCNSKRKALSSEGWMNGKISSTKKLVYGVRKNATYYFRISSSSNEHKQIFRLTAVKVKENSGAKKSKAVTLKSGKTVKGTIQAGSSAADWYKFKVTKKKKVAIKIKGSSNDKLRITVYNSRGKKLIAGTCMQNNYSIVVNWFKGPKLAKGTYYIKVSRDNTKSSGYYSLKWK